MARRACTGAAAWAVATSTLAASVARAEADVAGKPSLGGSAAPAAPAGWGAGTPRTRLGRHPLAAAAPPLLPSGGTESTGQGGADRVPVGSSGCRAAEAPRGGWRHTEDGLQTEDSAPWLSPLSTLLQSWEASCVQV